MSAYLISDSPRLEPSLNQLKFICTAQVCKNSSDFKFSTDATATTLQPLNIVMVVEYSGRLWKANEGNKREMYTVYDYTPKALYSTKPY